MDHLGKQSQRRGRTVEWEASCEAHGHGHTEAEHIGLLIPLTLLGTLDPVLHDFGADVGRSSLNDHARLHFLTQTEVCDLGSHILIDEDVIGFDVAVDVPCGVKSLKSLQDVKEDACHKSDVLSELGTRFQKGSKVLVGAELVDGAKDGAVFFVGTSANVHSQVCQLMQANRAPSECLYNGGVVELSVFSMPRKANYELGAVKTE